MNSNLGTFVCLDTWSGTFFAADRACVFDTRCLSPEELALLNEGTDTDRLLLADKHGKAIQVAG
jgi:hypothetical protein